MLTRREFLLGGSLLLAGSLLPGCRRSRPPVSGASSAERAVNAARRFAGTTLNIGSESGPQAQELTRFSGPLWQELTGIRINVVELGQPTDAFRRIMAEHGARTGALDCASVAPSWMPDLLRAGVVIPLDDYLHHYGVAADREDFLPSYRDLGVWNGRTYGLFDDGDALLLYYRKDLFGSKSNQQAFAARFGRPLGDPRSFDWQQFLEAATFFTDQHAPRLYGMAPLNRGQLWHWFQLYLRVNGGRFFDPATMKAEIDGPVGRRTLESLLALQKTMPPSPDDLTYDPTLATYLAGNAAMAAFWPPLGRWAEGYGLKDPALGGIPATTIAGKTGYALLPGGHSELAVAFLLSVLATSRRQEASYLFLQWLNSPKISLQRVMLPYALRDPYRKSHLRSPEYRALWPTAPEYLDLLQRGADTALLDLAIPGASDYEEAFYLTLTNIRLGMTPGTALEQMAEAWDQITDRHGRRSQRAAYATFMELPGAMPREASP